MRAVIDSVKGTFVRCLIETGDMITVSKSNLPKGFKEGDVLRIQFEIDEEATKKQRDLMKSFSA